ncbi:MAG: hypothetical protein ABSG94_12250 [Brevinematales bacterium]
MLLLEELFLFSDVNFKIWVVNFHPAPRQISSRMGGRFKTAHLAGFVQNLHKEFEKGKTNEIWHFDSKIKQCLFDKHPEEFIYSKANMYGDDEIFNLKKQGKFKFELFLYLKYIPPIFKGKTLKNRKHFTFVGENDGKMFKWIDIKPNTLIAHINRIINKFFKWVKKAG